MRHRWYTLIHKLYLFIGSNGEKTIQNYLLHKKAKYGLSVSNSRNSEINQLSKEWTETWPYSYLNSLAKFIAKESKVLCLCKHKEGANAQEITVFHPKTSHTRNKCVHTGSPGLTPKCMIPLGHVSDNYSPDWHSHINTQWRPINRREQVLVAPV